MIAKASKVAGGLLHEHPDVRLAEGLPQFSYDMAAMSLNGVTAHGGPCRAFAV